MAPPVKKQKTEEEAGKPDDAEMKVDEEPAQERKAAEPPKEHETDAPSCSKPKIKDSARFLASETTLNVLPAANNVMMALKEGGIAQFTAGARANIGIKSGRYMFE